MTLQINNFEIKPKSYSPYKDSGIPWLSSVPTHWEVLPNRSLFFEVIDRNHPYEEMLSVTIKKGVIKQNTLLSESSKKDSSNQDKTAYKLVQPGDIAYNKMRAWQGAIGISEYRGIISPAYIVVRLRKNNNPRYFHYLFRTPAFSKEAERWSYGITSDQWSLRSEHFKMIYSVLPPFEEQTAIVRFLEHFDHLIKRFILAKQKQIKLLIEQKQAIIHQSVTKGLNPNVKLKPSGVDWLGEIPNHWKVLPGRICFREKKLSNNGLKNKTVLSLSYGRIIIKPEEKLHGLIPTSFETYQIIDKDDIIVRPTDLQNDHTSLRFGLSNEKGIITSAYICLNTLDLLTSEYGYYLLHTYDLIKIFYGLGSGLRQNLSWEDFKYLPCLIPPISEQNLIISFIKTSNNDIELQIEQLQREITLLQEYRTSLIADVVTGKIDVREAVAHLPDEFKELENIEEEDISLDDEVESSEMDVMDEEEVA